MASLKISALRIPWLAVVASWAILDPQLTTAQALDLSTCSSDLRRSGLTGQGRLTQCPLPIDEDSAIDTGIWRPWKRRPYCVEPFMTDEEVFGPEFCLYTFEPFREDQGLTIITTPALAANTIDALDDAAVPTKLRSHSHPSAIGSQGNLTFAVKEVPGKEKGLVAQRRIQRWEVVLVDYPVMLAHMDLFDVVGSEVRQDLLERALHQLPEQQQSGILSLARSKGGEPVEDILRTNIFGVELGEQIQHLGLFPLGSVSLDTREIQLTGTDEISESIMTADRNVPLGLSYQERKEDLKNWGFSCTCSLCSASKSQRTISDQNRDRLQDIYHELNESATGKANLTTDAVTELAREMEALVREEGLQAQLIVHYGAVARAYMRVSDLEAARKYVDLCEDLWRRYAGEEPDYLAGMYQLRHELRERENKDVR
ncbi:hypothetical protein AAE478_008994 [Parahypoxylon ruwenzoriense]